MAGGEILMSIAATFAASFGIGAVGHGANVRTNIETDGLALNYFLRLALIILYS